MPEATRETCFRTSANFYQQAGTSGEISRRFLLYPGHSDLNYIIIGTPIRSYDSISQLCLRTNFMSTDLQYAYTPSHPHDYLPRNSFPTPEMSLFLPGYYLPGSHFMFPRTFTNTRSSDLPELRHIPVVYKP